MLAQILSHTPLWVWALLALLVYRGIWASVDREVTLKKITIIPLVMLALSWQAMSAIFGITPLPALCWCVSAAIAAALNWRLLRCDRMIPYPERGVLLQRGSWLPLALMMGIFLTKYTVAVLIAMQPTLAQESALVATVCALYGLFNGMFIGRLLRVITLYREAEMSGAAYRAQLGS